MIRRIDNTGGKPNLDTMTKTPQSAMLLFGGIRARLSWAVQGEQFLFEYVLPDAHTPHYAGQQQFRPIPKTTPCAFFQTRYIDLARSSSSRRPVFPEPCSYVIVEIRMSSIIEAFQQMRRRGLIAKEECICECCSQEILQKSIRRWREKRREIRGFVHVGESKTPKSREEARVPLRFGWIHGEHLDYRDPACVRVGEIVAECLKHQNIHYEWTRVPGDPILIPIDVLASALPPLVTDDGYKAFHGPEYPDSVFDSISDNPIRLLNVAKVRRLKICPPQLKGIMKRPRIGKRVKLAFSVRDAVAPWPHQEFDDVVEKINLESMWVEVTSVMGDYPNFVYCGELMNAPLFIDPAKLRIGSPVHFTPEHVCPVQSSKKARRRR